ncbi:MAG: hypothetical protein GOVbin3107_28 [Prokaryotic dsDNA virus sp.]|nr:MAG: hypothetical protein GOVbin3107_28 [Prokaryotic dsDNA virus sp.]
MDLKQKYTEEMIYEVEDYFMNKLQTDFDLDVSLKIAELINQTVHQIKPNHKIIDGHDDLKIALQEDLYTVENYGGVVHTQKIPTFFELEVETLFTEKQPLVALIDIKEVDCDRYLDLINKKKYLNESIKYNKTNDRRVIRSQS